VEKKALRLSKAEHPLCSACQGEQTSVRILRSERGEVPPSQALDSSNRRAKAKAGGVCSQCGGSGQNRHRKS